MSRTGALAPTSYTLSQSTHENEDSVQYISYGIDYYATSGSVEHVRDISCNKTLVAKMVEMFNLCALPSNRLKHIITDLLP